MRKKLVASLSTLLVFLGAAAGSWTLPPDAGASSHREAPLISLNPTVDNTDVYAFVSPDDPSKITLIANWIPFEEPAGGPNFYHFDDTARYLIKVDRDGDALEDVTYEWTFRQDIRNPDTFLYNTGPITSLDDPDFNYRQFYRVREIVRGGSTTTLGSDLLMPPDNIGPRSTPDYEDLAREAVRDLGAGSGSLPASATTRSTSTSPRSSTCWACDRSTGRTESDSRTRTASTRPAGSTSTRRQSRCREAGWRPTATATRATGAA